MLVGLSPSLLLCQGPDLHLWLDRSCGALVTINGRELVLVAGGALVDDSGVDSDAVFTVDVNTENIELLSNDGFRVTHKGHQNS